tara:strand:+ start:240 stop:413 length:174 start_codon:yes stop_codon:yes gene_type:complete
MDKFMPFTVSNSGGPEVNGGHAPPALNAAKLAFVGAKVFVSCWNPPTAIVAMVLLAR